MRINDISILIRTLNAEIYIEKCIKSLLCSAIKNLEILVVDDGSIDNTPIILEKYKSSNLKVFFQERTNAFHAKNLLLNNASGKYIIFIEPESLIDQSILIKMLNHANEFSLDLLISDISNNIGEHTLLTGRQYTKLLFNNNSHLLNTIGNIYKLSFLRENRIKFETTYYEDYSFMAYLLFYAKRLEVTRDSYTATNSDYLDLTSSHKTQKSDIELLLAAGNRYKTFLMETLQNNDPDLLYFQHIVNIISNKAQEEYERYWHLSKKNNLIIFSDKGSGVEYGIGNYITHLVDCFSEKDWDITIIMLNAQSNGVIWQLDNNISHYNLPSFSSHKNNKARLLDKYNKYLFYYIAVRIPCNSRIFCHYNSWGNLDSSKFFKSHFNAKIIFTIHYTTWGMDLLGNYKHYMEIINNPRNDNELLIKDEYSRKQQFLKIYCDKIIFISRHSYDTMQKFFDIDDCKISFIHNGIIDKFKIRNDDEKEKLRDKYGFKKDEILIIFAGRLDRDKGIIQLIKAFNTLLTEYSNIRLIIAGSGDFSGCLKEINYQWSKFVFTGYISKEHLYELFSIANIGVVPSIHEEFGYVAIEMMMNKLRMLVNNTTGLKEISANCKSIITYNYGEDHCINELKESLSKLIITPPNKNELDNMRNSYLKYYSFPVFKRNIENLYRGMENPYY